MRTVDLGIGLTWPELTDCATLTADSMVICTLACMPNVQREVRSRLIKRLRMHSLWLTYVYILIDHVEYVYAHCY
jgi:hypothetical protein